VNNLSIEHAYRIDVDFMPLNEPIAEAAAIGMPLAARTPDQAVPPHPAFAPWGISPNGSVPMGRGEDAREESSRWALIAARPQSKLQAVA
jgi:hypothetical protein